MESISNAVGTINIMSGTKSGGMHAWICGGGDMRGPKTVCAHTQMCTYIMLHSFRDNSSQAVCRYEPTNNRTTNEPHTTIERTKRKQTENRVGKHTKHTNSTEEGRQKLSNACSRQLSKYYQLPSEMVGQHLQT